MQELCMFVFPFRSRSSILTCIWKPIDLIYLAMWSPCSDRESANILCFSTLKTHTESCACRLLAVNNAFVFIIMQINKCYSRHKNSINLLQMRCHLHITSLRRISIKSPLHWTSNQTYNQKCKNRIYVLTDEQKEMCEWNEVRIKQTELNSPMLLSWMNGNGPGWGTKFDHATTTKNTHLDYKLTQKTKLKEN